MVQINTISGPYTLAEAVTPHDTNTQGTLATRNCDGLWVGGTGALALVVAGSTVVISAVPAGAFIPISASRVRATSTTATAIVALWA